MSRGRGPRTDAHVVVMVGGSRHRFCTYVHTMDKHRGQKAGYIFISSTHSSLEVLASVGSLVRSPAAAGLPIPAEIRAVQLVMRYLGVELRKGP